MWFERLRACRRDEDHVMPSEWLATAPDDFDPVFLEGPDGRVIAADWAAGFFDACKLNPISKGHKT